MTAKYILLDSAPLSTLANPARTSEVRAMTQWAADCDATGHRLIIPEIVDYEVRRLGEPLKGVRKMKEFSTYEAIIQGGAEG